MGEAIHLTLYESTILLNTMTASSEWLIKEHRIDGEGEMSVANTNNMI